MIFNDDRTEKQRKTHTLIVLMTDRCLSNWGHARDGNSYAGWACKPTDLPKVQAWVESRSDARRVRVVSSDYRPRTRHCAHCHIYVVEKGHPALARR